MSQSVSKDQEGIAARKETGHAGWTPEDAMARMLDLCEAQMDAAIRDSDHAVDALVKAFTELVVIARSVNELSKELAGATKHGALAKDLEQRSATITRDIGDAIVAFQFYDKLTQRMGHVRYSLSTLASFNCEARRGSPEHWQKLTNTLRRLYRTEEERVVFDAVTDGKSVADASLPEAQGAVHADAAGAIELF